MPSIYVRCTHCFCIQKTSSNKDAAICNDCGEAYVVKKAQEQYEKLKKEAISQGIKEEIVFYDSDSVFKNLRGRLFLTVKQLYFRDINGKCIVFEVAEMEEVRVKENYWRRGISFGRTIPNSIFFRYHNCKCSLFCGSGQANRLAEIIKKNIVNANKRLFKENEDFRDLDLFTMDDIDDISQLQNSKKKGDLFEQYCARLLEMNNFQKVEVIGGTGDMGADIIAWKAGRKIVIQCKCYKGTVAYHALEQTVTARKNYAAGDAIILTNGWFSDQTIRVAPEHQIYLWDRDKLQNLIDTANEILQNRSKKI